MKFGDKIYTYKDIEGAKKLIGKKVAYSNCLAVIENLSDDFPSVGVLKEISEKGSYYIRKEDTDVYYFQFIREVIDDEPTYRPFNSVDELIEHWCKNNNNLWQHRNLTMPLIWIKPKDSDGSMKEAILITEFWSDGVCNTYSSDTISWQRLFDEFEFLDGSPIGAKE